MDRAQKQESIETLKGVFAESGAVVVTHNLGLTVAEMTNLRARLREQGAQLKVVKNTLAQKALAGSAGEAGDALFVGPVAIAFGPDPVSAAKVATQFAKDNDKFVVVGGLMLAFLLGAPIITTACAAAGLLLISRLRPGRLLDLDWELLA
ncbi:MAG TPA: 50S ribosomal protein L10, partial [Phenylobacterium sp.]|nr:50S ribosomal protein L10 [Phenylobacterium sp.]